MQNFEFNTLLPANHYTNLNSMHLCFPTKILKNTDPAQSICPDLITVNNFHCALDKRIKHNKVLLLLLTLFAIEKNSS